jgi:hypothetical protein
MDRWEEFRVGDLPRDIQESIVKEIANYTVGFFTVQKVEGIQTFQALGSGTLVSVIGGNGRKVHAVLTAHHVVEVLPTSGKLGMAIGDCSTKHIEVDTQGLGLVKLARGTDESAGPDLGLVILSPVIADALEARKSFVDLDRLLSSVLPEPPLINEGVWAIQGFLQERTQTVYDDQGLLILFYNFTGIGTATPTLISEEHDYYAFPVDFDPETPAKFNGMSGGGLWQVQIDPKGEAMTHKRPIFSGVVFYQEAMKENEFAIRCHGRRSAYVIAGDHLRRVCR